MPRRARRYALPAALAVALVAALTWALRTADTGGAVVDVDFGTAVAATPRTNIGFTATTLDVDGGTVVGNARDAATLQRLGAGAVRIHLRSRSDGTVVTGAAGGDADVPADRWLATYCAMGLRPTVVVDLNKAGATDVAAYLRTHGCGVHRFVLGNEMDGNSQSDVSTAEYLRRFREIAAALRAADPTVEVGGPAPASFAGLDPALVDGLVHAPPDQRASFIDFHAYGAGRGERATIASAGQYADQIDRLRGMVQDPAVGVQVGEFNVNWAGDPQDGTPFQSVWVAAALGTILSRGAVAFQYGDKNQASGLVADGVPKAAYWGMAAFTGAREFRPFGTTMVRATSGDPALRVFASADDDAVVVVNTGDARSATVHLAGFRGGTATVWQSVGGAFTAAAPTGIDSAIELTLPHMSITTVVLDETRPNAEGR